MNELDRYVSDGNITLYVDQLRRETDPHRREKIKQLLIREETLFAATIDRLHMLDRHNADGEEIIARQTCLVARLKSNGSDATAAECALRTFKMIQDLLFSFRLRIHEKIERQRP